MQSISAAARNKLHDVATEEVQSLFWAMWVAGACSSMQLAVVVAAAGSRLAWDLHGCIFLTACSWGRDAQQELQLLGATQNSFGLVGNGAKGNSLLEDISPRDAWSWSQQKLAHLIWYVEMSASSPGEVLRGIEGFASQRGRQWLKVAGGVKAEVLLQTLGCACQAPGRICLEFGAFIGYTCIRLSHSCVTLGGNGVQVVSLEADPVPFVVARHFVDIAKLSCAAEVMFGSVQDVLPRVLEEFGLSSVRFAFLDYRGTRFHQDFVFYRMLGLPACSSRIVADNVLCPGAPLFLWHVWCCIPRGNFEVWTVPEFESESIEDWMVILIMADASPAHKSCDVALPPLAPRSLQRLAWETDRLRRRSTTGAVLPDDWAALSRHAKRLFAQFGIEAQPWQQAPA